ncbi:RagB/SusD family nutrient uptake outer membrane protein [uncultured Bacteroides sp.]|uniref:RagB/SusD family nutrient uptake outer membrane protein n=1 Tax=uncultured Bacteroides sp. TaxID=162156 RepID=UPI0025D4F057|nr:RagB/SusD family nutrient uptake outer membrane protein [uncultured Bacteroides sp.]
MNKIKYFAGAICLALSLNSCSDFLNEEPVSEIPAGEMWKTARDAKAGVNEIYGLLRTALRENYFYWGEFRSDNVAQGAPAMADQARVINNLMSTDDKCTKWTSLYQVINQTNLAIKYIPGISMPDVSDRNDYLGQAYALRALAYFYAIRVWGDVPLFTEPTENYSEAIYKERTDKNYILENVIIPDLKKAEGLINRNKNYERKRISICGVWAILADAYMWAGNYSLADQVIDKMATIKLGGKRFLDLEPDIEKWHTMFTEELNNKPSDDTPENDEYNSKELIFLIHFDMDEVGTQGYSFMYRYFCGSGIRAAVLSDRFMTLFDEEDMQGDRRKDYTVKYYQEGNELRKYMSGDISSSLNNTCEVAYPVYRYTDMLLLQAEARVRQGKWEDALALVKRVRDRAGLSTRLAYEFASENELIDYILRERQVELVGEGRRWFDLVRTGKWKEVMQPINGLSEDGNELFPIHYSHLIENPKLVQNSYYGNK